MAARPRAKVTGALAPVQMALLTAITHSANQTARDGTPALPLASVPVPLRVCVAGDAGGGFVWSPVTITRLHVAGDRTAKVDLWLFNIPPGYCSVLSGLKRVSVDGGIV